ncbi:unnamed protein product [Meganyctiphanes norvegica]|uniref:CHK kinase-like domain-containing protein n=1 Tax=Meganyctiphanes norvegica TaxID=48144 RepID=A0AAV2RHS8_MEGNR
MASFVTSIHVKFKKDKQPKQISYVVKITPCREVKEWASILPIMFEKEGKFYMELLPELNKFMTESEQNILPFPKCYYAQYEIGKEMLIFEDLRLKKFKMIDRRKGMDLQHASLVIQGLGHFHAASSLLLKKNSMDDLKSRYPFLFCEMYFEGLVIDQMCAPTISTAKEILSKVGGHEKAINWLDKQQQNIHEFFEMNYASCPPFNAICHGDCWNNNVLFRYDEEGLPVEVMLLDLQVNRMVSLATDLNHFIFASIEGPVRKPNIGQLLNDYYASFSSVIEGYGENLPFTKEELVQEFRNKNAYGLIMGNIYVPTVIMETEDVPDLENIEPGKMEEFMQDWCQNAVTSIEKNPACKPRFVAMYDEMLEEGLFN